MSQSIRYARVRLARFYASHVHTYERDSKRGGGRVRAGVVVLK